MTGVFNFTESPSCAASVSGKTCKPSSKENILASRPRNFAGFLFAAAKKLAFEKRAVFLFRFKQFWKRVQHRKFVRIARVNSRDERVNGAVEKFLIQPAQDKFGDAFFHAVAARRHERFARQGEFRAGGKKFRRQKFRLRRRHRNRFFVADDVAVFCRRDWDKSGAIRGSGRG